LDAVVQEFVSTIFGLLGMLIGEQIVPVGKHVLAGTSLSAAWKQSRSTQHISGMLPGRHSDRAKIAGSDLSEERS
jgi:xanthosine utilization system XapX-like protein